MSEVENVFLQRYSSYEAFTTSITPRDFKLIKKVGEGAFAKVYKATWISNKGIQSDTSIAIKSIPKKTELEDDIKNRVQNEAKILSFLSHQYIVKYFMSFEAPGTLNIVLEYLSDNLFTILQKRIYFGESSARYFSSQIVLALEYLHSYNIAYRDLKPENTLITTNGILKLTDFSFAKYISNRSYTCQGTLEYLAPEVLLNKGHGISVDWWAFGVFIYELCAGHSPFKTKYQLNLMRKIIAGKFQFPPHFTEELRDLIKKLIEVDITKRMGCTRQREEDIKSHSWYADDTEWNRNEYFVYALPKELNDPDFFQSNDSDQSDVENLFKDFDK